MKWNIGTRIGSGFAVAIVVFAIVGVISYAGIGRLVETTYWVTRTHEIISELEELFSNIQDAQLGERGYVLTGQERYLDPYNTAIKSIHQGMTKVRGLMPDNPRQHKRLDSLEPLVTNVLSDMKKAIDLRKTKGLEASIQLVMGGEIKKVMDDIRNVITEIESEEKDILAQRETAALASTANARLTIISGTVFTFIFVSVAGFLITRSISVPLREVASVAERVSNGDLSVNLSPVNRGDEIGNLTKAFVRMIQYLQDISGVAGQIAGSDLTVRVKPLSDKDILGNAFAGMAENLRRVTREIQNSVTILASSVSEILATTVEAASAATETATAVSETTATVEEVKQTVQVASQKSKSVLESAQKTMDVSRAGVKSVEETIEGMNQIQEQMESIAEGIISLSEQSRAIGEIITTVNDLAEQSNLLAVNAAIEAAKAGEQGKGFAVVAQEVKSLAEQSKQATAQVRSILNDIQKATSTAVMATEQGSKAVETGVKKSSQAGESIRMLAESIKEATQSAAQIMASSQQQFVGMEQIILAMGSIKTATEQNVAGARQTEIAVRNLHDLGQKLKQMVEQYRL